MAPLPRDPEDDALTLAALMQWQRARPDAAIVVAAADRGRPGEPLDIGLRLSNHSAVHLVGISMALINAAIEDIEAHERPNLAVLQRLRTAMAQLSGAPGDAPPRADGKHRRHR
jgi:hypothetical protein